MWLKVGFILVFFIPILHSFAYSQSRDDKSNILLYEVSGLKKDVSELKKEVSELKKDVSDLKREVGEIKGELKQINQRFEDINKRFEDMNKRFDEMSRRIEDLKDIMLAIFGGMVALVAVVIGFAFWDRRTIIKKAVEESRKVVEEEMRLRDLVNVLREVAEEDERVQKAMKRYGFM